MNKRELRSMVELKEFLKNPSPKLKVPVYTEEEKTIRRPGVIKRKSKYTLNQIAEMMNDNFKRLDSKMDVGFKQVNERIDRIETRLDYIVSANNLKDSK